MFFFGQMLLLISIKIINLGSNFCSNNFGILTWWWWNNSKPARITQHHTMVLNQPYLYLLTAALLSCAINQINGLFYLRNVRGALKTSLALLPPPIYFPIFYRERAGLFSLSVTHSLIARVRIRNKIIRMLYQHQL